MRTNRVQFLAKQEASPGVLETMDSTDLRVRLRSGNAPAPEVEQIDLEELQESSSSRPIVIGRKELPIEISYALRGPGDLVTVPAADVLLEAAMFKRNPAKTLPIGAVTSGPFLHGETITGGTSGATGLVIKQTADGDADLPIIILTGTFEPTGETVTGGTSGASATTSSAEQDAGYVYRPGDSDFVSGSPAHHISSRFLQDGFFWESRGSLANAIFRFRSGHPCFVEQSFMGAWSNHGDVALFSSPTYPEESIAAPRFVNAGIRIAGHNPIDVVDFSLTWETNLRLREDANHSGPALEGVRFADYNRAAAVVSFDPAHELKATFDYFGQLIGGTTFNMEWTLGDVTGSIWTFSAGQAQVMRAGRGDRDSLATTPLEVRLNGGDNDELFIWQH